MRSGIWRRRGCIEGWSTGAREGRIALLSYFAPVRVLPTLVLIIAICEAYVSHAQVDLGAERRAMIRGDAEGVMQRLSAALDGGSLTAQPLEHARVLETLGEQYHRLSDIGEAKRKWDEALLIRQGSYGDSSAEAAVGYAYRTRYHNYMAASQHDHQELALQVGGRAKYLLRTRKGSIEPFERILILREFSYAFKVAAMAGNINGHVRLLRTRSYFREALRTAIAVRDTIWIAQVLHDIGNTFTDEVGWSDLPVSKSVIADSGRICYQRSIELLTAAGFGTSEAAMMDHYTTALLYRYAYGPDSCQLSIAAFDRALRTMLQHVGRPPTIDPLHYDARITNPAQMVELLYQRAELQQRWLDPRTELQQLNDAIRSIEAAVPYWEQILRKYKSSDLEKVTGTYSHFPFRMGSALFLQRYMLNGGPEDLHRSFQWSERNRSALLQRRRMRAGQLPSAIGDNAMDPSTIVAPSGTVIIAFNHTAIHSAFVVDENGLSVTELGEIPANLDHSSGKFNEFVVGEQGWTAEGYAKEAFRWYQLLVAPILGHQQVRNVVIVPHGNLALLPFEALCTSPVAKQWSDVAFLGRTCTVRYARSVAEALNSTADCSRAGAFFATAEVDSLSDLPFAKALIHRLHAHLPGSALDKDLVPGDLDGALTSPGLLHLATHGVDPVMPDAAPLLLLSDGAWSAAALHDKQLQRTLAVLSTCSSGSGRTYQGEGVMSIAHAFLGAGTKSVVHTLWPVDDRATSEILGEFYAGLDDGLLASEALQRAKTEFIKRHGDDGLAAPFYWSGIVLTGNDVRLEPEQGRAWWYAIGAALLLGGGGYMFSRRPKRSRDLAAN